MDWDDYPLWEDRTTYTRTIVVAGQHPAASDDNPGTPTAPLRSINAAAQLAQPGERVRIHAGVYRELIQVPRGGTGLDAMISYEAAPGERAVVSGSRVFEGSWTRPKHWDEGYAGPQADQLTPSWSQRVWAATLPESWFADGPNPFALKNIETAEYELMSWAEPVIDVQPFALKRGMLFQEGQRLQQLMHADDLARTPGSFWVDRDGRSVLMHPFAGRDPNGVLIEVAVQPHLFLPQRVGLNYIRIAGLSFQHCANGFLRASTGAVTTRGGAYWLIEDNRFQQINSSGLEFGDLAFERKDPHPLNVDHDRELIGHVIVRRNHISHCGTAGIRSLRVSEGRVLDNTIHDCGWQQAEFYYECAGIKLLVCTHTLVAGNHISQISGACGIWMDWDIKASRVTRNVLRQIQTLQGAIFVEASREPNLIDRNVLWDIDGDGIFGGETEQQLYVHNLIGRTSAAPLKLIRHTDRELRGTPLRFGENVVSHNCFVDAQPHNVQADDNAFADNCYISTREPVGIDLAAWQERGADRDAELLRGVVELLPYGERLVWQVPAPMQCGEPHPAVSADFFERPWPAAGCRPGPLADHEGVLLLRPTDLVG